MEEHEQSSRVYCYCTLRKKAMRGALSSGGVEYASPRSISVAIQVAPSSARKMFSGFRSARTVQVQYAARWAPLKAIIFLRHDQCSLDRMFRLG